MFAVFVLVPRSAYLPSITNIRCPLLLVADFKFFNKMGNSNFETTASYLIGLIDRINHLFINTDFSFVDEDMKERVEITGVGFEIKRIIIHSKASLDSSHYNADRKWTVQDLLSAFRYVISDFGDHYVPLSCFVPPTSTVGPSSFFRRLILC